MDHISNIISSVQQGLSEKKLFIRVVKSKFSLKFCKILLKEGLISGYALEKDHIILFFKYINGSSFINSITRISKRSKRVYWDVKTLKQLVGTKAFFLVSTSKGLLLVSPSYFKGNPYCFGGEIILKIT